MGASGPAAAAGTPTGTPPTRATATPPCATTTTCTSRSCTDGTGWSARYVAWLAARLLGTQPVPRARRTAMSEQEAQVPDQVEGDPVVEVQEATDTLTPEEVREAQEDDAEQP